MLFTLESRDPKRPNAEREPERETECGKTQFIVIFFFIFVLSDAFLWSFFCLIWRWRARFACVRAREFTKPTIGFSRSDDLPRNAHQINKSKNPFRHGFELGICGAMCTGNIRVSIALPHKNQRREAKNTPNRMGSRYSCRSLSKCVVDLVYFICVAAWLFI